tara:strand:+ start:6777 stop:8714 length:1938 start_codon:yes stop_codon:yes gene_type:complete
MCGFVGIASANYDEYIDHELITQMTDTIFHRGPDDDGYHFEAGIGLGFRRLSIIDLDSGNQPMTNENQDIWLCFNGEIYNFQELRKQLQGLGHSFRSTSDTEVIIHAYEEWGVSLVNYLVGMFAFIIWDSKEKNLLLFRDRMGVKPMYWTLAHGNLIFGSEIKAILAYPHTDQKADVDALSSYLTFRHAIGEMTFYKGINKLAPGSYLEYKGGSVDIQQYYELPIRESTEDLGEEYYLETTRQLLERSVSNRMISDVPLGAYLSGGLDSSILVAMMSSASDSQAMTFSIGYEEDNYNEESFAQLVSNHCNTNHTQIVLSNSNYLDVWPKLVEHRDGPLSIPHEIALYQMSLELKKMVTVVLSGEGADELFGGYGRVQRSPMDWKKIRFARNILGYSLSESISKLASDKSVVRMLGISNHMEHFFHVYNWMPFEEKWDLFSDDLMDVLSGDLRTIRIMENIFRETTHINLYDRILHLFQRVHLTCLLDRLDMMSMAASVEARVPFVDDHELVEHVINIPYHYKLKWKSKIHKMFATFYSSFQASEWLDTNKYLLRKIGSGILPQEIAYRKKLGFPTPLDQWLKNGMLDYAKEILLDDMAIQRGLFDKNKLENYLTTYQSLPYDFFGKKIWMLTNIELWFRTSGVSL